MTDREFIQMLNRRLGCWGMTEVSTEERDRLRAISFTLPLNQTSIPAAVTARQKLAKAKAAKAI